MNPLSAFIAAILCSSQLAVAHKVFLFNKEIDFPIFAKSSRFSFVAQDTNSAADEQCLQDIEQLEADSGLATATGNLELCPVQQDQNGNSLTITMDYSSCSQLGNYQLACTSAGGNVASISAFSLECSVYYQGQTVKVSAYSKNLPACMGASCEGNLDEFLSDQQFQQEVANEIEYVFASEGMSADCSVGTSSPASTVILSKLALVGGLVALLANTV